MSCRINDPFSKERSLPCIFLIEIKIIVIKNGGLYKKKNYKVLAT